MRARVVVRVYVRMCAYVCVCVCMCVCVCVYVCAREQKRCIPRRDWGKEVRAMIVLDPVAE